MTGHVAGHVTGHVAGHVTGHVAGHVTGQTRFGHVTFPRSRASKVPESRFVTPFFLASFAAPQLLSCAGCI